MSYNIDYQKFTEYIFIEGNSKEDLFELWGYSIMDSRYLQQEFIKQAKLAYSVGDYELGKLNDYGRFNQSSLYILRLNYY